MIKFYRSTSITIAALTSLVLMILLWKGCSNQTQSAQQLVTSTTVEKVTSSQSEAEKPETIGVAALPTNSATGLLGSSVLLATCEDDCTMRLVNPLTGQDLPNYEPIELGRDYRYAFSPGGQTLAVIVSPWDWPRGSILHLVDLQSWHDVATEVEINAWINAMTFSPNGSQLAIASDNEGSLSLTIVDVAKQTVTAETSLNFIPRLLEYTPDGASLLSYGTTYRDDGSQAQVARFNSADLSLTWQQALPEVKEGLSPAAREVRTLEEGRKIHPQYDDTFETSFSVAWHKIKYSLGGWGFYFSDTREQYYSTLTQPDETIYLAGEHVSYLNGWMAGALESAQQVVTAIHEQVLSK